MSKGSKGEGERRLHERPFVPAARFVAERIVSGRVIDACGWWFLRQKSSRAELVELGVISRAGSYRQEVAFEELFGKPVGEISEEHIRRWLGQEEGARGAAEEG